MPSTVIWSRSLLNLRTWRGVLDIDVALADREAFQGVVTIVVDRDTCYVCRIHTHLYLQHFHRKKLTWDLT